MECFVGIDLGSTTTKAVVMDDKGQVLGRGITNSRSKYGSKSSISLFLCLCGGMASIRAFSQRQIAFAQIIEQGAAQHQGLSS